MTYAANDIAAVFGGSFDPLTLAHERIILSALAQLNAATGILIPCADEYIRAKKGYEPLFTAQVRLEMLRTAFEKDERLHVDPVEVNAACPDGRSLLTMRELKERYPGLRLIFVTGADKLESLPRWGNGEFLREFECAVCPRDSEKLPALPHNVIPLGPVCSASGISSGKVRTALRTGSEISGLVSPGVYGIIRDIYKTESN